MGIYFVVFLVGHWLGQVQFSSVLHLKVWFCGAPGALEGRGAPG